MLMLNVILTPSHVTFDVHDDEALSNCVVPELSVGEHPSSFEHLPATIFVKSVSFTSLTRL